MAGKSLNRVQLIGNLTRDPELRYTPTGAAVCSLGLATNRSWTTDAGEKREEAEFHRLVAWRKLAEICGQYLKKGSKVYVEGHLATRKFTSQDGQEKSVTEIVMDDMIMLDSRKNSISEEVSEPAQKQQIPKPAPKRAKEEKEALPQSENAHVSPDDIPF